MTHPQAVLHLFAALAFGFAACAGSLGADAKLADRTLVVWCAPANLEQRGAGVLGLEDLSKSPLRTRPQ
jgi:hypothetical protein